MFFKNTGLGLDIGSKKIKLVELKRSKTGLELLDFASITSPKGLIEQGRTIAPPELGEAISSLVSERRWKGRKLISALPDQEVFFDNYILPRMNQRESREAACYQSSASLPFPREEAVCDIYFQREFNTSEGRKREVFFIAAPRQQVEDLREVCKQSGLRLSVVEIPALALNRLWNNCAGKGYTVFLDIGYSTACFSVFQQQKLLFQRSYASYLEDVAAIWGDNIALDKVDMNTDLRWLELMEDFFARTKNTLGLLQRQEREMELERFLLCGGGARLKGLKEYLSKILNSSVSMIDIPPNLDIPDKFAQDKEELICDFPVAMGLAARGVWG